MDWNSAVKCLKSGKSIRRPQFTISWKIDKKTRSLCREDEGMTPIYVDVLDTSNSSSIHQSTIISHILATDWEVVNLTFKELDINKYFEYESDRKVKSIYKKLSNRYLDTPKGLPSENTIYDFYNVKQNSITSGNRLCYFSPDTCVVEITLTDLNYSEKIINE